MASIKLKEKLSEKKLNEIIDHLEMIIYRKKCESFFVFDKWHIGNSNDFWLRYENNELKLTGRYYFNINHPYLVSILTILEYSHNLELENQK